MPYNTGRSQVQKQTQTVTAKQLQYINLLSMDLNELADYITKAYEENPVIELSESMHDAVPVNTGAEPEPDNQDYDTLEYTDLEAGSINNPKDHNDTDDSYLYKAQENPYDSISTMLHCQLDKRKLDPELYRLCNILADSIDNGFIREETLESIKLAGIPEELLNSALSIIQALDPPGIGARNIIECLLLQIQRSTDGENHSIAEKIVRNYLTEMADGRLSHILRELGCSRDQLEQEINFIRKLSPNPMRGEDSAPDMTGYVVPDIYITDNHGQLSITLNTSLIPTIHISEYYAEMLEGSDDEDLKKYLKEKMVQANWLMETLEKRNLNILECARAIVKRQENFFLGKETVPQPLSRREISEILELHESTVSRIVSRRYVQFNGKVFPLSYFFSHAASTESSGVSDIAVKRRLEAIIRDEDRHHPYSDQSLCELLENENIVISRRTVAKYRSELGIKPASARKLSR